MSILCKLTFVATIFIIVATVVIVPLILKSRGHKPDISDADPTGSTIRSTTAQRTTYISSADTTRFRTTSTTSTSTRLINYSTISSMIQTSTYTSNLTSNSLTWCYGGRCTSTLRYYFEAVAINVSITGFYDIYSISSMDTYGVLYNRSFDSRFFGLNLLDVDDDSAGASQYQLSSTLNAGQPYVVVLTTYLPNDTGPFSISASGPGIVRFTRIRNTTVTDWGRPSNYSSELTRNSSRFCRTGNCSTSDYFYRLIPINISTSGLYLIFCQSTINTYGYIYNNTFNPLNLQQNLLRENNDGSSHLQFLFVLNLYTSIRYQLVVTSSFPNRTGSFVVMTNGPGSVSFDGI